jgi:chromate reductase
MKVLGISGSLRAASTNTALLRTAAQVAPDGVTIELLDWSAVPLYNADLGVPAAVEAVKEQVVAADALLFATPEYNYSVPGPLKNLIDWCSRPAFRSPLAGKPVGIVSAAAGGGGGGRAQTHLRAVLTGTLSQLPPMQEYLLPRAHKAFEGGVLVDEARRDFLVGWLADWAAWVERVRG